MKFSKAVLIVLFLFGVFSLFKAPGDPDFGWHYRYGEYLVQHGQLLRDNIYSYTFPDYKWANSYWISQVVIYITHRYLGSLVAGLLFAGVLSASVIYYVRVVSKNLQSTTLLISLSAILLFVEFSGSAVTSRPMYFSTLLLMFLVALLFKSDNKRQLWALPLLFIIWANAHADFVLGLFILGLYGVDKILANSREGILVTITRSGVLIGAGILSLAGTLINPFGLGLWQTLIKESHPYQFNYISEWVPADTSNIYYFAIYCAVLGLLVSSFVGARNKLPSWYVLALGFFCIAAVRSQYFFRIAVIVGIPAFVVFWSGPLAQLQGAFSQDITGKLRASFLGFLLLSTMAISAVFLTDVSQCINQDYWAEKEEYPKEALNFALANNIEGNVFNYYGWGGYMIWKYPQIKTFVDGRMPSWREGSRSVFEDYIKVVKSPRKNSTILADYNVSWILYPTDSSLVRYLSTPDSGWREVYSSPSASIFLKP